VQYWQIDAQHRDANRRDIAKDIFSAEEPGDAIEHGVGKPTPSVATQPQDVGTDKRRNDIEHDMENRR
jgi:hypothetical protein